jgi:hypothetical protein
MNGQGRLALLRDKAGLLARRLRLTQPAQQTPLEPTAESLAPLIENIATLLYGGVEHLPPHHRSVVVANARAAAAYTPEPYPGRITLFRAAEQPIVCSFDPEMAWGPLAKGGVDIRTIPGSHLSILQEPWVRALASELRRALDRPPAEHASRPSCSRRPRTWLQGRGM